MHRWKGCFLGALAAWRQFEHRAHTEPECSGDRCAGPEERRVPLAEARSPELQLSEGESGERRVPPGSEAFSRI